VALVLIIFGILLLDSEHFCQNVINSQVLTCSSCVVYILSLTRHGREQGEILINVTTRHIFVP